jgi:uncharacterized repeat protein (TIGR01451 family)
MILRDLPFPFREIGTELARIVMWVDKTAARIWVGFTRFPAWFVVTAMGAVAFVLTGLLFFTFVSSHDPTVGELAQRSKAMAPVTRETLEASGHWSTQDKWRLAHLFVGHRPPKRPAVRQLDSRLVDDFPAFARVPGRHDFQRRSGFMPRVEPDSKAVPTTGLILPDTEVRLDLGPPAAAEEPKRLVYGQYVREPGADNHPIRPAGNYRSRDVRLLVQAEWSPGPECDSEPFLRPGRRIIPVPDPQWDEPPVPEVTDDRRPDLSFQMSMLREFLPATAEFPPRSRHASVTAHSEWPESFDSNRSNLLADDSSAWSRTSKERAEARQPVEAYADRVAGDDEGRPPVDEPEHEPRPGTVPSFAEVALRVELDSPESTVAGHLNQSLLTLRNDGLREIPLVVVRESLAGLETVVDAIPAARVDQFENSLERHVQNLESGKAQRLELVWRPDSEGRRTHSAVVVVRTAVGATTEVVPAVADQPMPSVAPEPIPIRQPMVEPAFGIELDPEPEREPEPIPETHPGLSFDVQNLPRATVDDLVEIGIVVRNTGDVPLHGVRVVAQLPEQLKHRRGSEVEYTIDTLPVRGSERAVLRVVAGSSGRAVCQLHVAANEPAAAKSKAVIDVEAKPVRREPPQVATAAPPKPKTPTPAPAPKRPAPAVVPCCCQSSPPDIFEPWFIP